MTSRIGNRFSPTLPGAREVETATPSPDVSNPSALEREANLFEASEGTSTTNSLANEPQDQVNSQALSTPLGLLSSAKADILTQYNQLLSSLDEVVETFPKDTQAGISNAMQISTERILVAEKDGRITPEEAATSIEMMREMLEGIADLRTGDAKITKTENHGANVRVWNVRSPDGDEMVVSTRLQRDDRGEARFSIRHTVDDGVRLKGRHRMAVRLDLERWGDPSFDVQFGESALDKRIHGLFKKPDGTLFETPTGRKLADHHFKDKIPSTLSDPLRFTEIVRSFAENTMQPLEVIESIP